MKNRIIVLLTAWLICCAVQPFSVAIAEETRMDMFSSCVHKGDVEWTISQYFHPDYRYPLAELILVENAGHVQHSCNARYAWDFFKHFARTEDGRIIELAE
jgi:hypothetical protein